MTHGTNRGTPCPYCRRKIVGLADGIDLSGGRTAGALKLCPHCHRPIYLWVRLEAAIDAEQERKVK